MILKSVLSDLIPIMQNNRGYTQELFITYRMSQEEIDILHVYISWIKIMEKVKINISICIKIKQQGSFII